MYDVPKPEEIRAFLKKYNLTGSAAAKLVGVDSRTVRKWTSPRDAVSSRKIPWSAWALLRLMVGDKTNDEIKQEIKKGEET